MSSIRLFGLPQTMKITWREHDADISAEHRNLKSNLTCTSKFATKSHIILKASQYFDTLSWSHGAVKMTK